LGPVSFRLRLFVLGLALSTFLWGLQAKLSLYEAPTPSHPLLVVKLLQDWQINKKVEGALPQSAHQLSSQKDFCEAISLPVWSAASHCFSGRVRAFTACSFNSYALYSKPPPAIV